MTAEPVATISVDDASMPITQIVSPLGRTRLSLRANFSWMFVANVVYAGCQWGMLAILAKLGTAAMVGQFVLALAISTPVMAFFMLQLRLVQATDTRREYAFGDYLALRLITSLLGLATIAVVPAIINYSHQTAIVLLAVGASAAIDSVTDIVYGLMQQRERMDRMAQSMMIKGTLSLIGMFLALHMTAQVVYGVLAVAASRLLVLLAWDLPNAARLLRTAPRRVSRAGGRGGSLLPRWNVGRLFRLARLSAPLGFVMMLIVLSHSIPRYFVEFYRGEHLLGIFGAIGYVGLAGIMAVGALGESATARLAHYYASRQTASFCRLLLKLSAFGAALAAAGIVAALVVGRPILAMLYGPEYAAHTNLFVWMMVAAGISYVVWFVNHSVTAVRYFRSQLPLHLSAATAAAGACWWLVPRYGLIGAAWAMCLTALVQLVGAGLVISHALWAQEKSNS